MRFSSFLQVLLTIPRCAPPSTALPPDPTCGMAHNVNKQRALCLSLGSYSSRGCDDAALAICWKHPPMLRPTSTPTATTISSNNITWNEQRPTRKEKTTMTQTHNTAHILQVRKQKQVNEHTTNCLHFSICACHPCAGAMLIFFA